MNEQQIYLFHQTPKELAKDLMPYVPLVSGDRVCEPFRGEGAFYNAFPPNCISSWAEIQQGKDFRDLSGEIDWVITNPPFKLEVPGKRVNAFWYLLDYYTQRVKKGVAFLANDACFCTLTPRRMKLLQERGFSITKIVVCSVKKWRGRYFFFLVEKRPNFLVSFLQDNY